MFIKNFQEINKLDIYECGAIVSKYLIGKGVPLLSHNANTNKYIFKNTLSLRIVLMDAPIWVKVLI